MRVSQDGSPVAARRSLLTTRAAAEVAACDPMTIRRAVRAGELRAVRLGRHGHLRIPAEELAAWLEPAQPEGRS